MATKEKEPEIDEMEELASLDTLKQEYEEDALKQEEEDFKKDANYSGEGNEEELPPKDEEKDKGSSGDSSGDSSGEENWEKMFKDTQSSYTKSQQEKSEVESQLGSLEKRLERLGGVDNIEKVLSYIENDQDFRNLFEQKKDSKNFGISEEGLTPDAKEVLSLVKKIATAAATDAVAGVRGELGDKIDPYIEAAQDRMLGDIYDKMDKNYGEQWSDKLEAIQEMTADWSDAKLAKLKYSDVEEQYIIALKRAGEFDDFAAGVYKKKLEMAKEKSMSKPTSGKKMVFQSKGKVKNMFDAAKRAELRKNRG